MPRVAVCAVTVLWVRVEGRHRAVEPLRRLGRAAIGLTAVAVGTPILVLMPLFWLDTHLPAEAGLNRLLAPIMTLVLVSIVLAGLVNVAGAVVATGAALVGRARLPRGPERRMAQSDPREPSLFLSRVRDLIKRPPVTCVPGISAVDVAQRLSREDVGSVVVLGPAGDPVGIVTDRDLRRRVVAEGRDPATTPVGAIMSSPLVTLRANAFAFEAVLEMTRHRIRHVVLVDEGRLVGVVSSRDFLGLQTTHPVTLAREIAGATSLDSLANLAGRITTLVRRLVDEGGTIYDIGQLVAELNDRIVVRVLGLAAGALEAAGEEAPPVRFCWLSFGSEARREQTLRTDQDNGLVVRGPAGAPRRARGRVLWQARRRGHPESRPHRVPAMSRQFHGLESDLVPAGFGLGRVFPALDERGRDPSTCSRPASTSTSARSAARWSLPRGFVDLVRDASEHRAFIGYLARDVVARRLPLTIFGNVAVHRAGPHRGAVDLKGAGGLQLVGAARVYNLALALGETNTLDRFRAAAVRGVLKDAESREIADASSAPHEAPARPPTRQPGAR